MAQWFEVKVTYTKTMGNGLQKRVTEPYLFDCLSFTEAEARATEELSPCICGEFTVKACKIVPISEIYRDGHASCHFYLAKIGFIAIDEKTRAEKISVSQMLIEAFEFGNACDNIDKMMRSTMADYKVISLAETPIVEVYPAKISK